MAYLTTTPASTALSASSPSTATPHFPPEVWQNIFAFAAEDGPSKRNPDTTAYSEENRAVLWQQGRLVCKDWKANIEETYLTNYLCKHDAFRIIFQVGPQGETRFWLPTHTTHPRNYGTSCPIKLLIRMIFECRTGSHCTFKEDERLSDRQCPKVDAEYVYPCLQPFRTPVFSAPRVDMLRNAISRAYPLSHMTERLTNDC